MGRGADGKHPTLRLRTAYTCAEVLDPCWPASLAARKPDNLASRQPGSQATSQAPCQTGDHAAGQQGSQAARQPAKHPASNSAMQPDSKAARQQDEQARQARSRRDQPAMLARHCESEPGIAGRDVMCCAPPLVVTTSATAIASTRLRTQVQQTMLPTPYGSLRVSY